MDAITVLNVSNVNAASTSISVTSTDVSKYLAIADFAVTLVKTFPLNVVGDASYATLYLPVDITTDGTTKAYYITTANNGYAQLTLTANGGTEIPARTAVALINSEAATSTILTRTSGLSSVVSEDDNMLKGTLVDMTLDLAPDNNNYSLGRKKDANGDYQIGFYKFSSGGKTSITLGANKAYLQTAAEADQSVKGFALDFNIVDGLGEIVNRKSVNGQCFDLAGRRVSQPTRGLYIVDGKKVAIK